MSKLIDLTGQTFGKLKVLKKAENKSGKAYWTCQCECGTIKDIRGSHLRSGSIISCGCQGKKNLIQKIDLTGQKFGRLTVIKEAEKDKHGFARWLCQCECGNKIITRGSNLREGKTKSCGCINKEQIAELGRSCAINLTNKKFGKLTALYPTEERHHGCVVWYCQCDCGKIKKVGSDLLLTNKVSSCGCIGQSFGEEKITKILNENNIKYQTEVSFETCYNPETNMPLRFDFYIENRYIIEFDGEQHFKFTGGWNTEENLKKTQFRDNIKNQWCKDNNIPLIRIPYWYLDNIKIEDLLIEKSNFIWKE